MHIFIRLVQSRGMKALPVYCSLISIVRRFAQCRLSIFFFEIVCGCLSFVAFLGTSSFFVSPIHTCGSFDKI